MPWVGVRTHLSELLYHGMSGHVDWQSHTTVATGNPSCSMTALSDHTDKQENVKNVYKKIYTNTECQEGHIQDIQ